ncbi:MAG: transcriptional repressor NrdR [Actinobacteria bacterium]|nr:transcriptional repressor NrdR [Actinomycetota bacterium]MSX09190.1 transcriptional repressor NrdR [Actinomycetota bacterium]
MRCPFCAADDDRVVDSRMAEEGGSIRRRRECVACGQRFTTFERIEEMPLVVEKRSGSREPFDRSKVISGVNSACKNRPVSEEAIDNLASQVEESLRSMNETVTTQDIGVAVLERLKELDDVAYVRFASVYKGFEDVGDFQREVGLLTKSTAPKRRS